MYFFQLLSLLNFTSVSALFGQLLCTTQWRIQTFRWGGEGGGHPDPEIGGGGPGLKNKFFQAFEPQFGRKIRGGPGPSLGSATASRYPR